ncbi:MAG: hypothetical protein AAF694_26895 [Bacteroidota bacterium]
MKVNLLFPIIQKNGRHDPQRICRPDLSLEDKPTGLLGHAIDPIPYRLVEHPTLRETHSLKLLCPNFTPNDVQN